MPGFGQSSQLAFRYAHPRAPSSGSGLGGPVTAPEVTPRTVVWWKTSLSLVDIPRRHSIGWCDSSGTPFGSITIVSPHPRLDRRTIETALTEHLAATFSDPPRLGTAAEFIGELTAEARLRAGGHAVLTRDLAGVYGDHALGGVVATLLGKGVQAYVLIDQDASHAARTAICQTAEQALTSFVTADPDELYAGGWERGHEDRWQLLLRRRAS